MNDTNILQLYDDLQKLCREVADKVGSAENIGLLGDQLRFATYFTWFGIFLKEIGMHYSKMIVGQVLIQKCGQHSDNCHQCQLGTGAGADFGKN